MAESLAITLHTGAVFGAGSAVEVDLQADGVGLRRVASLGLDVVSGGGDLTVYVDTGRDAVAWREVAQFSATVSPLGLEQYCGGLDRYVRARWETASAAEFTLSGDAVQSYATLSHLYGFGLPRGMFDGLEPSTVWGALVAATGEVRTYLGSRSSTIVSVGIELSQATAKIAALELLTHQVGVDAAPQAIELVVASVEATRQWLRQLGAGKASPDATFADDTSATAEGAGYGASDPSRGWEGAAP